MATRTISTRFAIEGEAEYKSKLKSINAELGLHKSELEKVSAQYKNSANSLEALSAKQDALKGQLGALDQKYAAQAEMLEKTREAQKKYADKAAELKGRLADLADSSRDTAEEQEKLQKELAAAEESMQKAANSVTFYQKQLNQTERDQYKLGDELKRTEQYLDEAKASADGCAKSIDQYGKEVKQAGESAEDFTAGTEQAKQGIEQLAAALAAAGVAKAVKEIADELLECAGAAANFETAMAKVSTLAGRENLEDMKARLVELSDETGVAVGSLAEAAYQAMSAGVDAANAVDLVSTATKTSVAGFTDSAVAVDVLTTALNAYKLEGGQAERVASMLVKTQDEGKTSVGELAQNMGRVIPVAAAYNVSLGNLTTSYALLTKNGTNTAIATTNLTALFNELAKKGSSAAYVLQEQTGKSFAELMGSGESLGGVMNILSDSVEGDATAFSNLWSSTTAGQAALSLLNSGAEEFNRTLNVMENSSGAVDRNFQTMADTTEFASQRMANAADNLRIAIGGQLNPALENLYGAGADAFTWATDFVEENPWVVAAITGVTAALGALTVGTGALAAANAPAVITAIKGALDLLSANPVILVTAALVGLGAAVGVWVSSADDASNSTREFTDSLKESKVAYEDLMASMGEEQASAGTLAGALKELMGVEDRSATRKELIRRKVDELNEAVPGLSLAYDEAADALVNMDTGVKLTTDDLDAMLGRAAGMDEYNAQMDRLSQLSSERVEISNRLEGAQAQLAEAEEKAAGAVEYTGSSYAAAAGTQTDYSVVTAKLRSTVEELSTALEANAAETAELEAATAAFDEIQGENIRGYENAKAAAERVREELTALQQSYVDAKAAAMESLERQMGLFDEMDGKAKKSIGELIETLSGQAQYMDDYAANLQKAMELGVDQGLVKKLSDGSQQSAQILAAIVEGGTDDITALNEQFARVEEGKDDFASTLADLELEFSQRMDEINQELDSAVQEMDQYEEAYKAHQNTMQGGIDGVMSKLGELTSTYSMVGGAVLGAYQAAVDQHSPSRKFAQAGRNDIQGLIEGVEAKKAALGAAYEALGELALGSYAGGVRKNWDKIAQAMSQFDTALKGMVDFYDLKANVDDLEYRLWERTYGENVSEIEKYAKQLELLERKQSDQMEVVKAAAAAYEAAAAQYGEGTVGSYEYQKALLEEKLTLQDLLDEIERVTQAKQELDRQSTQAQIQAAWDSSGLGRSAAAAGSKGSITPYEAAQIAGTRLILPDGSEITAAYEDAAQTALAAMATHLPSIMEAPSPSGALARQMESLTAAAVNAISDVAQSERPGVERVRIVTVDGKVLAEAAFDDFVDYGDANGTPIVNPRR